MDREDVRSVATLARLRLTADEELQFSLDLQAVLHAFRTLDEVSVEGVPPTVHPVPVQNRTRSDTVEPSLPRAQALARAEAGGAMSGIFYPGGLAALVTAERLSLAVRAVGIAAFVGAAALPFRTAPIDAFHLGEHRLSETLSIALRWAGTGFWTGFPDSRYVVDAPRREILDAVRARLESR